MSRLLAATLGRLAPKYKTFSQWVDVYSDITQAKGLNEKTHANRRVLLRHLAAAIGDRTISSIRPQEIAMCMRDLRKTHPNTAKRALAEARAVFATAVEYGWTDTNPALPVMQPPVKVARKRLSLEDWQTIHDHARADMPPWVARMMVLALVTGQRRGDIQKMRFGDVFDGHLHITQQKTGTMLRLPVSLRMDVIDTSIAEAIEHCHGYAPSPDFLIRKSTGYPLSSASLSARFETAREAVFGLHAGDGDPPSLHEIRSLSERMYRRQGIDTKTLLGHARQSMTDRYNDDRGLSAGEWKTLEL